MFSCKSRQAVQASDPSTMAGKLKVFLNTNVDVSSWKTIMRDLRDHPRWSYVAFARDDEAPLTALSYRWDGPAFDFAKIMSTRWDSVLRDFQAKHETEILDHVHSERLKPHVAKHKKLWVDQHCIPQVEGRMGCIEVAGQLYHGPVIAAWLTTEAVDKAFAAGRAHELLGELEGWLGRGWVQQEVTARGKLVNLDAFEHFFKMGKRSRDARLTSGGESLCLLLRRMKGEKVEPIQDRIVRFYAVNEADFTVEEDRGFNIPSFADMGYEAFDIGKQPAGYKLQPEIRVHGERVAMVDANGNTIAKWFRRKALYTRA
ncbi:uncharacterized protein MONBRDRAFT_31855 [Monosiga brevicollis MX1]|uniref:Uncharacterized protein n=1 Tax=Monosiga brevicollis TaxID=81824 RepID=A9UVU3_MONBE|nr:uncharacterized protein MONBRDRAFT_31855 [Monosiga brevicollis MX1]EDQ90648.1 predicted protein [Monosiga brevicollis MX1]|eukprot:XP_001744699.1 hypothetical protein [Monosiga brevicollis MX1]